jgi:hypothetical protein
MSEFVKIATTAGDQYLTALSESQETFLKAMGPYKEFVSTMPKMPAPAFAADVPTMQEVAEANFAFANKLLKQQKKFVEKLFETTVPAAS